MQNNATKTNIKATIVIPTFNGEKYLGEVLAAVFNQETDFKYEVIVIDSGSTDNTIEIAGGFPVRLIRIRPEEFNHGGTRNLGVSEAAGEFVAFLTQDAIPAGRGWLANLVKCFEIDAKVGAVFGKHIPRTDCDPITRRDIEGMFRSLTAGEEPVVQYIGDEEGKRAYAENEGLYRFYSDVNSCLKKSVWREVPYEEVAYAEDQVFGRDILEQGYMKVYCPRAAVFHSHSYPVSKMFRRFYDEFRGLNVVFGYTDARLNPINLLPDSISAALNDSRYIFSQNYSKPQKLYWSWYSFWWNFLRRAAIYLGGRHQKLPKAFSNMLSLEYQVKKGN